MGIAPMMRRDASPIGTRRAVVDVRNLKQASITADKFDKKISGPVAKAFLITKWSPVQQGSTLTRFATSSSSKPVMGQYSCAT